MWLKEAEISRATGKEGAPAAPRGHICTECRAQVSLWMAGLTTAISDSILTVSAPKCMSRQWDWAVTERELQAAPVHPAAPGIVQVRIKVGMNSWGGESLSLWASVSALNHLFTDTWSTLVFSLIKRVCPRNAFSPGVLKTLDALCSSGHQTLTIIHPPGSRDRPRDNTPEVAWKHESWPGLTLPCFTPKNGLSKMW